MTHVKSVPATYQVKADEDSGGWIVEGYASVFGNVDSYGDIVYKGAFSKSIKERMPNRKVRFFYDHAQPLGVPLELSEDGKGLKVRARISKTALGHDVKTLVEDGAIGDFSFGYDLVEDKCEPNKHGGLDLREIKLYEFSLVGVGANEEAVLTGVKSVDRGQAAIRAELQALKNTIPKKKDKPMADEKAASGSTDLPLADEGMSWDSSAAEKTVASWAEGEDGEIDWSKYGQAFFWRAESPEGKQDFKLPFAQVMEGALKAVPAGVKAGAAAVQGSRGGVDIPEADIPGVKAKIKNYYGKMDMAVPWEDDDSQDPDKAAEDAMDEGGGEAPTAAEVTAALKVFKALVDAYQEPSEEDTPEEDSEPPQEKGGEGLHEKFRAEMDKETASVS